MTNHHAQFPIQHDFGFFGGVVDASLTRSRRIRTSPARSIRDCIVRLSRDFVAAILDWIVRISRDCVGAILDWIVRICRDGVAAILDRIRFSSVWALHDTCSILAVARRSSVVQFHGRISFHRFRSILFVQG